MNAYKCLEWVKAHSEMAPHDLRTSRHVVEWLADDAKGACHTVGDEALCDAVKARHAGFINGTGVAP